MSDLKISNGIFNSLIGGLIGIIGFSLSGMAIMVGLFNKKQIQLFIKLNGENKIEQIMSSYAFLAFISAMVVALLLGLSCLFSSEIEMISPIPFWIIVFLIIYLILFDLLYAVALVFNCILMFGIKQTYDVNQDEAFLPMANEIRIDYILRLLVQICDLKHADVMKHLENETSNLSKEERIKLKEYFAEHYPSDDKE